MSDIQAEVLNPEAVDYALRRFQHELERHLRGMPGQVYALRHRKQEIRRPNSRG